MRTKRRRDHRERVIRVWKRQDPCFCPFYTIRPSASFLEKYKLSEKDVPRITFLNALAAIALPQNFSPEDVAQKTANVGCDLLTLCRYCFVLRCTDYIVFLFHILYR